MVDSITNEKLPDLKPNLLFRTIALVHELRNTNIPLSLEQTSFNYLLDAPLVLSEGQPLNTYTVGKVLPYILPRLPAELIAAKGKSNGQISIKPVNLVLTNDHAMFSAEENQDKLQTAPSRRRWYIVEEKEHERNIYLHIRDETLGGGQIV